MPITPLYRKAKLCAFPVYANPPTSSAPAAAAVFGAVPHAPKVGSAPLERVTNNAAEFRPPNPAQVVEIYQEKDAQIAPQNRPKNHPKAPSAPPDFDADFDAQLYREAPDKHSENSTRLRRFALQRHAAKLLPDERVSKCLCHVQPHFTPEVWRKPPTDTDTARVKYARLTRCGSIYNCPVCGAIISQERNGEIKRLISACRDAGHDTYMITLTFPHTRQDSPRDLRQKLADALRWFGSHSRYKSFAKSHGLVGTVRAVEVTHGHANGFHPHVHAIFVFEKQLNYDQSRGLRPFIYNLWRDAAVASGLPAPSREHGVQITQTDWKNELVVNELGDYISKLGGWGMAEELCLSNRKQNSGADGGSSKTGGRSPARLLADSFDGDEEAGRLFVAYAQAFKGYKALTWSSGLKKRFSIGEKADEQVAEESHDSGYMLFSIIPFRIWCQVVKRGARGAVLNAAVSGDLPKFQRVLSVFDG